MNEAICLHESIKACRSECQKRLNFNDHPRLNAFISYLLIRSGFVKELQHFFKNKI